MSAVGDSVGDLLEVAADIHGSTRDLMDAADALKESSEILTTQTDQGRKTIKKIIQRDKGVMVYNV